LQATLAEGYEQMVQMLLVKGVDVNAQDKKYGNALYATSKEGHDQVMQMLLAKGVDVNA